MMKGWHSSDGWSPEFVFGELPQGARSAFADDAGEMQKKGDGMRGGI